MEDKERQEYEKEIKILKSLLASKTAFANKLIQQKKEIYDKNGELIQELKKYQAKDYELKTAKRLVKIAKEAQEIQLRAEEREGQRESRKV